MEDTDTATVTLTGEPFDPQTIDINHPNIVLNFRRVLVPDSQPKTEMWINWMHDYDKPRDHADNVRPDWADLSQDDRVYTTIDPAAMNHGVRQFLNQPGTWRHELPCPPYEYSIVDGKLQIEAGAFSKSGTKAEWTQVLAQMQEEVEGMPNGIDITDMSDITVNLKLEATTSIDLDISMLLDGHDLYVSDLHLVEAESVEGLKHR
jgi:hypothetical protein